METFGSSLEDRQDLFDSQAALSGVAVAMLVDFNKLWDKHYPELDTKGLTDEYYDGVQSIADKYKVNFNHPKYSRKLTEVGSSVALH